VLASAALKNEAPALERDALNIKKTATKVANTIAAVASILYAELFRVDFIINCLIR
jgi:hypothetical protein